jgi:hypothetical protein
MNAKSMAVFLAITFAFSGSVMLVTGSDSSDAADVPEEWLQHEAVDMYYISTNSAPSCLWGKTTLLVAYYPAGANEEYRYPGAVIGSHGETVEFVGYLSDQPDIGGQIHFSSANCMFWIQNLTSITAESTEIYADFTITYDDDTTERWIVNYTLYGNQTLFVPLGSLVYTYDTMRQVSGSTSITMSSSAFMTIPAGNYDGVNLTVTGAPDLFPRELPFEITPVVNGMTKQTLSWSSPLDEGVTTEPDRSYTFRYRWATDAEGTERELTIETYAPYLPDELLNNTPYGAENGNGDDDDDDSNTGDANDDNTTDNTNDGGYIEVDAAALLWAVGILLIGAGFIGYLVKRRQCGCKGKKGGRF